jgi:uncharacterized protein (DUF58 family)
VDWKATAKSGSLKVREFAREDERKLCIVFDNPEFGAIAEDAYEQAVDLTASLAWHFSNDEAEVSFLLPGRPRTRDLHEFLAALAVVKPRCTPSREQGVLDARDPLCEMNITDEYNIVVTARPRGTVPTALWNSSYFVFVGDRRDLDAKRAELRS